MLARRIGVVHQHLHEEAVQLRLRQGIGAFLLDGILGGHDHVQLGQPVGHRTDRDLPLAHRLQQRGLNLGRSTVDLVGQDKVVEQRAFPEHERAVLRAVDLRAGQVRGQQVRRELQAMEVALHAVAQHLDGARLGQTRRALHQQVPVAQQRDQHAVEELLLPDHETGQVPFQTGEFILQ